MLDTIIAAAQCPALQEASVIILLLLLTLNNALRIRRLEKLKLIKDFLKDAKRKK